MNCFNRFFFFQAEDGIRDAQESRGLGDVYKRQILSRAAIEKMPYSQDSVPERDSISKRCLAVVFKVCLLYTSDAADDLLCVDLGGRRIIQKKTKQSRSCYHTRPVCISITLT